MRYSSQVVVAEFAARPVATGHYHLQSACKTGIEEESNAARRERQRVKKSNPGFSLFIAPPLPLHLHPLAANHGPHAVGAATCS